ncbi:hypothetical protein D7030_02260 [Flavobacteriaceae bacterium AU392]|nr:hypothetical protein D1817_08735 [Flavobacteriaceae bacterium]RKM85519.1 hypothetical protein D7030_02260 [Flavobacteriaceae bacterium AU392]
MKNLLKLGKALNKAEQKSISGGFWGFGCQPQLLECETDQDCPSCSFGCGRTTTTLPDGTVITFDGICSF